MIASLFQSLFFLLCWAVHHVCSGAMLMNLAHVLYEFGCLLLSSQCCLFYILFIQIFHRRLLLVCSYLEGDETI